MRHLFNLSALLALVLFALTGCSQKKYYEATQAVVQPDFEVTKLQENITHFNRNGATLKDQFYVSKKGISSVALKEGFFFLNESSKGVISSNFIDTVMIADEVYTLKEHVMTATLDGSILALITSSNTLMLYDINERRTLLKKYYQPSLVNDIRIASPIVIGNIIVFPMLNGQLVVVSKQSRKIVNELLIDPNGAFNNISFLQVVNDTLIAATAHKVASIQPQRTVKKDYEVRDIIVMHKELLVATVDGRLIKMNEQLDVSKEVKFKYAKFYTLAFNDNIYVLESQRKLFTLDSNLENLTIYDLYFDKDKPALSLGNKLYYGDDLYSNYLEVK